MKWYRKLYLGEKARKNKYSIIWKINHRAGMVKAYVITLPSNESNVLDIYNSAELMQKHYRKQQLFVVGIASGYAEALEVVRQIIEDVYRESGGVNVKDYIMNTQNYNMQN